ncbi:hypothetical protein [Aureispira sp. CCB-QB1]|uniref:hypothetical protein n=1 Tax=Aureispira sp. CCB-QB1 TaxID=1313421 RepID=UPI0012DD127A|nr:hypothetical protein [Aureispira sp. CCB-QB1]
MSVYGLKFKIQVFQSLKLLSSDEQKEVTLSQILDCFILQMESKPNKEYKKTLRNRVRACLWEWEAIGFCSIDRRQHPNKKYIVLYYKIKTAA